MYHPGSSHHIVTAFSNRMHVPQIICRQIPCSALSQSPASGRDKVTENFIFAHDIARTETQSADCDTAVKSALPLKLLSTWRKRPHLLLLPPPTKSCNLYPTKPTDLPDEVLLSIFQYLTCVRDIAAVRGVCRAWRRLVDHTATIWRSLVFDLPRRPTTFYHAESWYRKAADFGNAQAQVSFPFFQYFRYPVSVLHFPRSLPVLFHRLGLQPFVK